MSNIHYYSNYIATRDIDCFFKMGDVAYHFASNGQPIPDFITRKRNIAIQEAVYSLRPEAYGAVKIHEETIRMLIENDFINYENIAGQNINLRELHIDHATVEEYAASFVEMAMFGFVSMDLDKEGVYHIIAEPTKQEVSDNVMELLPEVDQEYFRLIIR